MESKSGVKIPEHLFEKFEAAANEQKKNGQPTGGESEEPGNFEALESLNETLSWICETSDRMAKNAGYPGLGDVPPEKLGGLLTIVAKRNIPEKAIEKSPETATIFILGGIAFQNWLEYNRRKQEAQTKVNRQDD